MLSGLPDLNLLIRQMRAMTGKETPDSCILVPGMFRFATLQEILSLIAPRPVLLLNAVDGPPRYAIDLYRMAGVATDLSYVAENDAIPTARYAMYAWLARRLQQRSELTGFTPSPQPAVPVPVQLQTHGAGPPRSTAHGDIGAVAQQAFRSAARGRAIDLRPRLSFRPTRICSWQQEGEFVSADWHRNTRDRLASGTDRV